MPGSWSEADILACGERLFESAINGGAIQRPDVAVVLAMCLLAL